MSHRQNVRASVFAAAGLALVLAVSPARAQPTIMITGCENVVLNGHAYVQYDFRVYDDPANHQVACVVEFSRPVQGAAPDDTCSFVASVGPPGWVTSGTGWFADCFASDYIQPGGSLSGFSLVMTRPCCFDAYLSNVLLDPFGQQRVCLDCATPARDRTWGALKAIYR